MDEQLENRLRFLRDAHTEGMPHSGRALFDHLLGTRQLLVEWGARPALCDAGLFHSIYSTEHYEEKAIPLSRRGEVQELIGGEAESVVWLFCMMRREAFFQDLGKDRSLSVQHRETGEPISLSGTQHQDLLTLLFANSLEGFPRCSWVERRGVRRGLRLYRRFAMPPLRKALDRYDVRWWEVWKGGSSRRTSHCSRQGGHDAAPSYFASLARPAAELGCSAAEAVVVPLPSSIKGVCVYA